MTAIDSIERRWKHRFFIFSHLMLLYMELQSASRTNTKIKMGLQGPSSSGKTYSALLIAYGLCGSWERIAVIDTENGSSHLYAHLGAFRVLSLGAPFTPERYIEAVSFCQHEGMAVIIIDSISHEWDGNGGILQIHGSMAGNSFTNWSKVTPRHNAMMQFLLQCETHIICTIRSKQEYVLTEKNGKVVPEKVGLKGIQRNGLEYDLTLLFTLDTTHQAMASKDRTELFYGLPATLLTSDTGKKIRNWCVCNQHILEDDMATRIQATKSLGELIKLYQENPRKTAPLKGLFEARKTALLTQSKRKPIVHNDSNLSDGKNTDK
jgi:hypothetical protein